MWWCTSCGDGKIVHVMDHVIPKIPHVPKPRREPREDHVMDHVTEKFPHSWFTGSVRLTPKNSVLFASQSRCERALECQNSPRLDFQYSPASVVIHLNDTVERSVARAAVVSCDTNKRVEEKKTTALSSVCEGPFPLSIEAACVTIVFNQDRSFLCLTFAGVFSVCM